MLGSKRSGPNTMNELKIGEKTEIPAEAFDNFLELSNSNMNGFNHSFPLFQEYAAEKSGFGFLGKGPKSRERTKSIEMFLAQSPGQALGSEFKNQSGNTSDDEEIRERENKLLQSPISSMNEEFSIDGLRTHLVALNLNVDNHVARHPPIHQKPNYSLSGAISMTPNPRTEFKSPKQRKRCDDFDDSFTFAKSSLRSKLVFDNNDNSEILPSGDYDFPNVGTYDNLGLEHLSSGSLPVGNMRNFHSVSSVPPPSYANFQPMQQVILPNGMAAMVVPMADLQQGHMKPLRKAKSFDSYNNYSRNGFGRRGMASPVNIHGQGGHYGRSKNQRHSSVQTKSVTPAIPLSEPLSQFEGRIFQMSQEQNGCRYLQQKVDLEADAAVAVLHEVRPVLTQLMMDPFGNYLFQKLIERVSDRQRLEMLQRVKAHLVQASLNLHGTRSVQKFVELCGRKSGCQELMILIEELEPHVTKLSMDTNGNHVVQRCLQHMSKKDAHFVYEAAVEDVLVLTRHRHGCCVFQRCLDAADGELRARLIGKIIENAVQLVQDPFGNYVVQYVLENCQDQETALLISQVLGMLPRLSTQKFSSNVIEKCLVAAPEEIRAKMIDELSLAGNMRELLHDQYANYVVQRALLVADDKQGKRLVNSIRPHLSDLAHFNPTCAKRVAGKVLKRFPSLGSDQKFVSFAQGGIQPHSNGVEYVR